MRLTHLTFRNWRNFKEVDTDLEDRLIVVGPNASGKSNLLDGLRFLRQIAGDGGGFQEAVASRSGIPRVRCLAARNFNHGHVTLKIAIGDDETPREWAYEVTFAAEPRGRHRPILKREVVSHRDETIVERPSPEDHEDPERMTQTWLEQVNANRGFREIAEFLDSIRYLHLVPHLIRQPERSAEVAGDPYGSDILLRMARTPARTRGRRFARIGRALQAAVPQLDRLELVQDDVGRWHLEARYEHWRPQGARHDERMFSDGTLRLIGLLWVLLDGKRGDGPVLLEEPELSLHESVVRQLPTVFSRLRAAGGPQVVLTTHADAMLEDEGLGLDEVLVLKPGIDGTEALRLGDIPDASALLEDGLSLAEVLARHTEPAEVTELQERLVRA